MPRSNLEDAKAVVNKFELEQQNSIREKEKKVKTKTKGKSLLRRRVSQNPSSSFNCSSPGRDEDNEGPPVLTPEAYEPLPQSPGKHQRLTTSSSDSYEEPEPPILEPQCSLKTSSLPEQHSVIDSDQKDFLKNSQDMDMELPIRIMNSYSVVDSGQEKDLLINSQEMELPIKIINSYSVVDSGQKKDALINSQDRELPIKIINSYSLINPMPHMENELEQLAKQTVLRADVDSTAEEVDISTSIPRNCTSSNVQQWKQDKRKYTESLGMEEIECKIVSN